MRRRCRSRRCNEPRRAGAAGGRRRQPAICRAKAGDARAEQPPSPAQTMVALLENFIIHRRHRSDQKKHDAQKAVCPCSCTHQNVRRRAPCAYKRKMVIIIPSMRVRRPTSARWSADGDRYKNVQASSSSCHVVKSQSDVVITIDSQKQVGNHPSSGAPTGRHRFIRPVRSPAWPGGLLAVDPILDARSDPRSAGQKT